MNQLIAAPVERRNVIPFGQTKKKPKAYMALGFLGILAIASVLDLNLVRIRGLQ